MRRVLARLPLRSGNTSRHNPTRDFETVVETFLSFVIIGSTRLFFRESALVTTQITRLRYGYLHDMYMATRADQPPLDQSGWIRGGVRFQ